MMESLTVTPQSNNIDFTSNQYLEQAYLNGNKLNNINSNKEGNSVNNDALLEQVFSAIKLIDVHYKHAKTPNSSIHNSKFVKPTNIKEDTQPQFKSNINAEKIEKEIDKNKKPEVKENAKLESLCIKMRTTSDNKLKINNDVVKLSRKVNGKNNEKIPKEILFEFEIERQKRLFNELKQILATSNQSRPSNKRPNSTIINLVKTKNKVKPNELTRTNSEPKQKPATVSLYEESVRVSEVLQTQLNCATLIKKEGNVKLLKPQIAYKSIGNYSTERIVIGGNQAPTEDDKVVLLYGSQGSGKTSLVISILNHVYDVKKEHDFRLCIQDPNTIQTTTKIIEYVFNNTIYPFRLTFVDSPGVPNIKGYNGTSTAIRQWFQNKLRTNGKFRLDAISFVIKHNEYELDWPLVHELATVKRLFSDDLKTNLLPIITFSEILPQPLAIRSLTSTNIHFLDYYKVQNNSILPLKTGDNALRHSLHFNYTNLSLERYISDLHNLVQPLMAVLKKK